jgi:Na+-translocating ferredoxin:NAD+ oxidoreductase subunit C
MSGALHGFRHGVHPPELKELTAALPIRRMPFPEQVVLPLRQHAGAPAQALVKRGDRVERGDKIGASVGFISSPVHASAAGRVADIDYWPHPDGSHSLAIRIAVDARSVQLPRPRLVPHWRGLDRQQIVKAVQEAGVVGLGGAAFPAHVKLSPPPGSNPEVVIVNGAECEPYLTTDHRVMVERPQQVYEGLRVMLHALGLDRAVIGVEKNKPDAIEVLRSNLPTDIDVTILPLRVKYPQGAEKMLIHAVLGREVPSGQLPISVGAVVQNVGSVATIGEVFETGLPLIERVVTVTGRGVRRPSNLVVPVGARIRDVLDFCGGLNPDAAEILFGGPMMGTAQANLDTPITKGTTGLVVLTTAEVRGTEVHPCIRCGRCVEACPVFLNPSRMGALARAGRLEELEVEHLADCMLCGSCSYVCPSNIPLAQLFASSKTALRKQKTKVA